MEPLNLTSTHGRAARERSCALARGRDVRKTVLENGLRVITENLAGTRSVSMAALVDCGPGDETAEQAGLAHLCEHLFFQGTSSRDAVEIARFMDRAGGKIGGFTGRDYTCYHATVLDDYATFALDLLGDLLLNSTFPPAAVERQKQILLAELAERSDTVSGVVADALRRQVFPDHFLGRPIGGDAASIERLGREDVIYFVHRHYTPDRIILAAAGALDHDDFVAQARDAFWRMLGEGPPRAHTALVPGAGVELVDGRSQQAHFALALPAPRYDDADRYAFHALAKTLGGGVSSRLFRRLREEHGLAYDIAASLVCQRDAGLLMVEGATAPEMLPLVLELAWAEVRRLLAGDDPMDAEELTRATTQLRAEHLIAGDDPYVRMSRLATQELYFGGVIASDEIVDGITRLTPADIVRAGDRLQVHPPSFAVLGPARQDGIAAALARAASLSANPMEAERWPSMCS